MLSHRRLTRPGALTATGAALAHGRCRGEGTSVFTAAVAMAGAAAASLSQFRFWLAQLVSHFVAKLRAIFVLGTDAHDFKVWCFHLRVGQYVTWILLRASISEISLTLFIEQEGSNRDGHNSANLFAEFFLSFFFNQAQNRQCQ